MTLQWGHRLSAMETISSSRMSPSHPISLQWGHRLSAMETSLAVKIIRPVASLQWGHRLSAMDRRNDHRCRVRPNTASMGPPPFGDGNDGRQDQGKGLHPPSMGPPPFSDGNLVLLLNLDTLGVPSMGPSPFSDGNDYLGELPVRSPPHPSMGPPPFSDGNLTIWALSLTRTRPFNGATAFQRWKQLFVARLRHGFMKKRSFPQESVTG